MTAVERARARIAWDSWRALRAEADECSCDYCWLARVYFGAELHGRGGLRTP